jgi:hypothetical protein
MLLSSPRPFGSKRNINAPLASQVQLHWESFFRESFQFKFISQKQPVWYNNIRTGHSCRKVMSYPRRYFIILYYSRFVTLMGGGGGGDFLGPEARSIMRWASFTVSILSDSHCTVVRQMFINGKYCTENRYTQPSSMDKCTLKRRKNSRSRNH